MATISEKQMRDAIAAFNAHDVEKYLSFSTDDILVENLAAGVTIHGKEEARANLKNTFALIPDVRIEIKSFFTSGDHACLEYILSGTPAAPLPNGIPATGKSFSVRGAGVSEYREDKVCKITQYADAATLMRQLGVLPPPPQK